ncbi:MAG: hypothetical protein WAM82_33945 [Thermoanaerobaculia bacterium]
MPLANPSEYFVKRIRHSGLLLRRPNPSSEARRTRFIREARAWLEQESSTALQNFDDYVAGILIAEQGYHAVLEALEIGPNGSLSAEAHIWALITFCGEERSAIDSQFDEFIKRTSGAIDPHSLYITNDNGFTYDPDAVTGALIDVLASTLIMFGYQFDWFDQAGVLEIPSPAPLPSHVTFHSTTTMMLGEGWRLLDYSTERWRFFDGTIERGLFSAQTLDGETLSGDAIRFRHTTEEMALFWELADTLGHDRLDRLFLRFVLDANILGVGGPIDQNATRLSPDEYISACETSTIRALCHALHFDVVDDDTSYAGLQLREWIRGYATLIAEASVTPEDPATRTCSWTEAEILAVLERHGMSECSSRTFLSRVTFGRNQKDLFDAPLIRSRNRRLYCFPRILTITNIPRVILSHLGTLSAHIARRGEALEIELRELFRENGLRCKRLHFRHEGEEYECDGAVVWDKRLFLFECKNRTMSGQRPSKRHRFVHEVLTGVGQLGRLVRVLSRHPELVETALGSDAKWNTIVPCVLNGLPWSLACTIEDTHVYDMSALSRFFESGALHLQVPIPGPNGLRVLLQRTIRRIWRGQRPTADDLIAQLRSPLQLEGLFEQFVVLEGCVPLTPSLTIITPSIRRLPRSFEGTLEAYADNPQSVGRILEYTKLDADKDSRGGRSAGPSEPG